MNRYLFSSFVLAFITISLYAQDPNILWQRTIGGSGEEFLSSIISTADGGFIVGGRSDSNISGEKLENSRGGNDYWVLKLDNNGIIEWQRTLGGDIDDRLNSIFQTSDGGYVLAGTSASGISGDKTEASKGGSDYWIIKLSPSGNIEWQKTLGGNNNDSATNILQTADGGYIVTGNSTSSISGDRTIFNPGIQDIWILKLDLNGNIEWQQAYSFIDNTYCAGLDFTADGGYIIGYFPSTQDLYGTLKIASNGTQLWEKIYGCGPITFMTNVKKTNDSGYIMTGFSDSDAGGVKSEDSQGFDYWIIKVDQDGEIEWENTIGGAFGEGCYTTLQSSEGGYFVTGYSDSPASGDKTEDPVGASDYWIIKLNEQGIIEWQNTIGGADSERIPFGAQLNDGTYIVGGQSESDISGDKTENSRGDYDFWVIKHNSILNIAENSFSKSISLYPNPTKNSLQINTQDKTIDQINIYTITGSKILQLELDTVSPTVDVSSLAMGVYYVQLYSGKNVAVKKFVKE